MPDVEVAVAVLRARIQAVLRKQSETIQGTVVEAMTVRVTDRETQPVRQPLGKGGLQAVVIGTANVVCIVDVLQVGELGGDGFPAKKSSSAQDFPPQSVSPGVAPPLNWILPLVSPASSPAPMCAYSKPNLRACLPRKYERLS
jgi:hypothetical protein